ncbi:hypothetical protein OG285_20735 [Streptomyces sp. NBC_01471]|uniref:hypothetical protein n=1 Tax=Streptomyces sp. NBC_01471 TaxID=2903879 RepID=UPI00324AB954
MASPKRRRREHGREPGKPARMRPVISTLASSIGSCPENVAVRSAIAIFHAVVVHADDLCLVDLSAVSASAFALHRDGEPTCDGERLLQENARRP